MSDKRSEFLKERDAKKAAKKSSKAAEKEAKYKQIQDKVVAEYNEKRVAAEAAGDPMQKIKAWC